MATTSEIRILVEDFTNQISQVMRRAALEEVRAKLSLAIGDVAPKRRGPGRPRSAVSNGAVRVRRGGKRTSADLEALSDRLFAHVKSNPGQRADQIAATLRTDVGTMRLPMQKLIAGKKVKVKGQRRGTKYFAK